MARGRGANTQPEFDVFLSHSHQDAEWVEKLAGELTDQHQCKVWLDRWVLVPGARWQQAIVKGLRESASCAVCLSSRTPQGWFSMEIELAMNHRAVNPSYRILPVLIPGATEPEELDFLGLHHRADFRLDHKRDEALHLLLQGVRGLPAGRRKPSTAEVPKHEKDLMKLRRLYDSGLLDKSVWLEYQRIILAPVFGK